MIYKAEYIDDEIEVFSFCISDDDAMDEALSHEDEHGGILCSLYEVDEDCNEIRTVY